jgi:hypothetical protein
LIFGQKVRYRYQLIEGDYLTDMEGQEKSPRLMEQVRICDFSKEPGAVEPPAVSLSRI